MRALVVAVSLVLQYAPSMARSIPKFGEGGQNLDPVLSHVTNLHVLLHLRFPPHHGCEGK